MSPKNKLSIQTWQQQTLQSELPIELTALLQPMEKVAAAIVLVDMVVDMVEDMAMGQSRRAQLQPLSREVEMEK